MMATSRYLCENVAAKRAALPYGENKDLIACSPQSEPIKSQKANADAERPIGEALQLGVDAAKQESGAKREAVSHEEVSYDEYVKKCEQEALTHFRDSSWESKCSYRMVFV